MENTVFLGKEHKEFKVEKCKKCRDRMINVDADDLVIGDLERVRRVAAVISSPYTKDLVCLECDRRERPHSDESVPSRRAALSGWFRSNNSDSGWFGGGSSGSSSSGGGFDFGSFGGFGGGGFSGGGASGGF